MPIRQDVQGGIQPGELASYQGATPASPRFQDRQVEQDAGSAFWVGLASGIESQIKEARSQVEAAGYLRGQQDSLAGKERQEVHAFMEESYTQGYNRATVGADLSKYQNDLQVKAVEYVNSGKSAEEFDAYAQQQTDALLSKAGASGMDLNKQDWQAWLNGVDSTRNTSTDLYRTKALERSQYMRAQAYAAEGNSAAAIFLAADEAGNPMQALGNIDAHKARIYSDDTMTPQQKDGAFANFAMQLAVTAKSAGAVEAVSSYLQASPEYQSLPTETQTQIIQGFQSQYNQRAADEVTGLYTYISEVRAVSSTAELEAKYPMPSFIAKLNEAQKNRQITPAQAYSLTNEEYVRRMKTAKAEHIANVFATGTTLSDIATNANISVDKAKSGLVETTAQANGGYSGGGLALVQRGQASGAGDIVTTGIEMLQQDAASLASLDPNQLKKDNLGNAQYPITVVNSVTNLKTAYDALMRRGNQAQANMLLAGLPDAVAYGITQNVDANSMMDVVYRRSQDLASRRAVSLPATMPKELLAVPEDLDAGLFDTNMTEAGQRRNILGIQSYGFRSDADDVLIAERIGQVNGAVNELYTSLYMQGRLPAREGEALKNALLGRVAANTVRIEDGTDAGSLLILPDVQNKAAVYGSADNNIIAQGLKDHLDEFKKNNPGAHTIQLAYDSYTNELVVSATDAQGVRLTSSEGISTREVQDSVRSVQARLTNDGQGNQNGNLSVPGVGMVPFSTQNSFGVNPAVMGVAVNQLVSYEGYTDTKGFSILATHPTTGAPLNDARYVKQPGDSPQVATQKLGLYLNDKVLPDVMKTMPQFNQLPEFLRETVFKQLVETTYHAGNADAFGGILTQALNGDVQGAYQAFRESPLYIDAGPTSRRNKDRAAVLEAVSRYGLFLRTGNTNLRP